MAENSAGGALVPAVKTEATTAKMEEVEEEVAVAVEEEVERDILCPICMQTLRDVFLTACGHSFCYMCISTHLNNKRDCPCCGNYLTSSQIFPNLLLDKV